MWKVNYQESLPLLKKYREASLPSDSPQMHRIRAAAKENSIFVSLGYSEVDLNSLYTTQVMIDPTGNIVSRMKDATQSRGVGSEPVFPLSAAGRAVRTLEPDHERVQFLRHFADLNPSLQDQPPPQDPRHPRRASRLR